MRALKDELLNAFYRFWYTYAERQNGPETINDLLSLFNNEASTIGTGEHELATKLEEILLNFSDDFKEYPRPLKVDFIRVAPKVLSPTSGFVEAHGNFEVDMEDGETIYLYLRFTNIFVLKDHQWLLIHGHLSFPSAEQDAGKAFPFDAIQAEAKRRTRLAKLRGKKRPYLQTRIFNIPESPVFSSGLSKKDAFIQEVKKIIGENYADDNFSLPQLCQKIGMSRSQLFRKMKISLNISPSVYIKNYRLDIAKSMLKEQGMNVSETAFNTGFKDPSYFSKVYQERFGVIPSDSINSN